MIAAPALLAAAAVAAGGAPDGFSIDPSARDDLAVERPAGPARRAATEETTAAAGPAGAEARPGRAAATYEVERAERLVALAAIRGAPAADIAIARARVRTARRALEEGRTADAVDIARRAVETLETAGLLEGTPADPPTTEAIFRAEALWRDRAAEGAPAWRLETARELIDAARGAAAGGDFTASEDLAGRAVAILSAPPAMTPPPETAPARARRPPVDLNRATEADLLTLPGMTPARIRAILWWREHIGSFVSPIELRFLPGFDSYYVLLLLERVTVGR